MTAPQPLVIETTPEPTGRLEWVPPELANQWLTTHNYRWQRRVRPFQVARLVAAIESGEFKPGILQFALTPERLVLIDGQHRLSAVVATGRPQRFYVIEHPVESDAEIDELYGILDTGMARQVRDAPQLLRYGDALGVQPKIRHALISAAHLLATGFSPSSSSGRLVTPPSRRYQALHQFEGVIDEVVRLHGEAKQPHSQRLLIAGVMAVEMVTLRDQPKTAVPFWEKVARQAGYEVGDGEHHLVTFLNDPKTFRMPADRMARYVASAWNLAYAGETRRLFRTQQEPAIRIAGTYYDGKNVRKL